MNYRWEQLTDAVHRCRLPFLDVTVGLVQGSSGVLLVDSATTPTEAYAIADDVRALARREVTHIVLTHKHFDHVLGASAFPEATIYCAPAVAEYLAAGTAHLRADALRYGVDSSDVDQAIAALRPPDQCVRDALLDLGGRTVLVHHPGPGHTNADLVVVAAGVPGPTVVFCGDLVEESGDPAIDDDSDPAAWPATLDRVLEIGGRDALYVPGHGAVVDANFVRDQQRWLRNVTKLNRRR